MDAKLIESILAQYDALLSGRGAVWLTNWSSLTITGADRQAFLHNFCTNDIKRLVPGQSCEAFFTNVKGKIVGHGLITCRDSELVVIGVPQQAPRLIEHLDRYVIREDVQLRDTTAERSYLMAPRQVLVRDRERGNHPDSTKTSLQDADYASRWHYCPWKLIRGEGSGLMEIPTADLSSALDSLRHHAIDLVDSPVFEAARIEAGVPLFGVDFDERNLPQEVGRNEQAISFTKGCYLGQETVARIDALGHVNQQLAGVRFLGDSVPEPGTLLIHESRTVGHVTSATYSPRVRAPLALAMLRREHAAVGHRLDSPIGEGEVVALPI